MTSKHRNPLTASQHRQLAPHRKKGFVGREMLAALKKMASRMNFG
jgi:hypothetical protein